MKNIIEIGDVYYCYRTNDKNKRGKFYKIKSVFSNEISIETEPHPEFSYLSYRYYYVNTPVSHWSKFSDYFTTVKDLRKMKLKKLNGILDI